MTTTTATDSQGAEDSLSNYAWFGLGAASGCGAVLIILLLVCCIMAIKTRKGKQKRNRVHDVEAANNDDQLNSNANSETRDSKGDTNVKGRFGKRNVNSQQNNVGNMEKGKKEHPSENRRKGDRSEGGLQKIINKNKQTTQRKTTEKNQHRDKEKIKDDAKKKSDTKPERRLVRGTDKNGNAKGINTTDGVKESAEKDSKVKLNTNTARTNKLGGTKSVTQARIGNNQKRKGADQPGSVKENIAEVPQNEIDENILNNGKANRQEDATGSDKTDKETKDENLVHSKNNKRDDIPQTENENETPTTQSENTKEEIRNSQVEEADSKQKQGLNGSGMSEMNAEDNELKGELSGHKMSLDDEKAEVQSAYDANKTEYKNKTLPKQNPIKDAGKESKDSTIQAAGDKRKTKPSKDKTKTAEVTAKLHGKYKSYESAPVTDKDMQKINRQLQLLESMQ